MTASTHTGVVVGVDGSSASNAAIVWATRNAVDRRLPLTLVHAINGLDATWPESPDPNVAGIWQEVAGRRILDEAVKLANDSASDSHTIDIDTELLTVRPAVGLNGLSKQAELVVVGNRGRGALARGVLGSISASLVTHAHCPVAVIHDPGHLSSELAQAPVVLGTDGSPASELATDIAFEEASLRHVDLVAVHAWSDFLVEELPSLDWSVVEAEEQRRMTEGLAEWKKLYPAVAVRLHLVRDRPAHAIAEESKTAQLVVLGSRGRGRVKRTMLGSVSNAVVQAVQVPIIVARR